MKTDSIPQNAYLQTRSLKKGDGVRPIVSKVPELKLPENQTDYKVDLSPKIPAPSLPTLELPDIPRPKKPEIIERPVEVKKLPEIKNGSQKTPAIFFIKGLDIFSSPLKSESGYAGLGKIAESIEGSRLYGWDQKEEMIREIKKVHPDYPVVLVGHSLGGDTAVEIADQLDSLKEGFRPVDLLITIDAVGLSHDIIPQNVKKHLNVFGETSLLLNDGPHVARREEKTQVRNILSPLDHTDIDDDREIQYEVVNLIQETLKKVPV